MSNTKKQYNTPDVDDENFPPPAYQETPPFNPNYQPSSSNTFESPPFNPSYAAVAARSPPHTQDNHLPELAGTRPLYPQIPTTTITTTSPPPAKQQPRSMPHPQPARYQTIEIPYPENTVVNHQIRQRQLNERRKFPLAAFFFLFGW
jgi:hypothetical protein